MPPGLTVQLDVKAHADEALARRTVSTLAALLARRADAGRVEVLSFHAAAVEQAVAHGLAGSACGLGGLRARRARALGRRLELRGVCVEHFLLSRPLVAALRDAGLSVTTVRSTTPRLPSARLPTRLTR